MEELRPHIGDVAPVYMHGHCMFRTPAGPFHAPASLHLMLSMDRKTATFVCHQHQNIADAKLRPIDRHDVTPACIAARSLWVFDHPSYCEDPHDANTVELATQEPARELVGVPA
jgi:hypothetical protein